jgi:hypothetical protein
VVHIVTSQEWCLQCDQFWLGFDPCCEILVLTGVPFVTAGIVSSDGGMACQPFLLFQNAKKSGLNWHCFNIDELCAKIVSWGNSGQQAGLGRIQKNGRGRYSITFHYLVRVGYR